MLAFTHCLICMTFTHCFICIHIESATEEVVYEVIAEPQEQTDQANRSFVTTRPKAQWTLALSSSPQASPGARPFISNYHTYDYVSTTTCALGLGFVGTLVA